MYEQNVYGPPGEEAQYLLEEVCHRKLPDEKGILITKKDADYKWKLHGIKLEVENKLESDKKRGQK